MLDANPKIVHVLHSIDRDKFIVEFIGRFSTESTIELLEQLLNGLIVIKFFQFGQVAKRVFVDRSYFVSY